jgi:hypothetical protein
MWFLPQHSSYSVIYWSSRPTVGILPGVGCISVKAINTPLLPPAPPPPKKKVTLGKRFLLVLWFTALSITPLIHNYHTWFSFHRRCTNFATDSASLNTNNYHQRLCSSVLTVLNNTNNFIYITLPPFFPSLNYLLRVRNGGGKCKEGEGPPCHGSGRTL